MNLITRTIATTLASFAVLIGVFYLIFSTVLVGNFEKIEEQHMKEDIERVIFTTHGKGDELGKIALDWGHWDDTYAYVETKDPRFEAGSLGEESIRTLGISHMLYLNRDNQPVTGFSLRNRQKTPLTPEETEALSSPRLISTVSGNSYRKGIVSIGKQRFLVVAVALLDSERTKPRNGTLVMTRRLDDRFFRAVSRETRLLVHASNVNPISPAPPDSSITTEADLIEGRGLLRDINGAPALLLKVEKQRTVYLQGLDVRNFLFFYLSTGALIFTAILVLRLHKTVIFPLYLLGSQVNDITRDLDPSQRVRLPRKDEVGELAARINLMLVALENAQLEMKKAKNEAERASASKSIFVANISHELRTPLHAILGMLRLIAKDVRDRAELRYVRIAENATYTLLGIINDVLDISKIESGRFTLGSEGFSLRSALRAVLEIVGQRASEKGGVELLCDIDSNIPDDLLGDPIRFKQILLNLLSNGVKFTPEGYVLLTMRCGEMSDEKITLECEVKDTGIGIAEEKHHSIFDAFVRGGDKTESIQGTGLGLAITRELIEAFGGTIRVESKADEGSRFIFSLELKRQSASTDRQPRTRIRRRVYLSVSPALPLREYLTPYAEIVPSRSEPEIVQITDDPTHTSDAHTIALLYPHEVVDERAPGKRLSKPVIVQELIDAITLDEETSVTSNDLREEIQAIQSLRVVIADDSQTNRIILASMLEERGHQVIEAADGAELVALVAQGREIDLILTDIRMPHLDGLRATREVRRIEEERNSPPTPIVAVTAQAFNDQIEECLEAGMNGVLVKPIEPVDLENTLRNLAGPRSYEEKKREIVDFDYEGVLERAGSERRARRILTLFLEEGPLLLAELQRTQRREELGEAAHKLAGAALQAGALRVGATARALEKGVSLDALPQLETELSRALSLISQQTRSSSFS